MPPAPSGATISYGPRRVWGANRERGCATFNAAILRRKNIDDVVVRVERGANRAAGPDARGDLLPRQVEDRVQDLRACTGLRLSDDEEDAGAVLDVARRQQLPPQDLHD